MGKKSTSAALRLEDLPKEAEIENDMIGRVRIRRDRGFILGLTVEFASGRQPFFNGYNNTCNIGHMVLELAKLLGVNEEGECEDILAAFGGTPCRVASNAYCGDIIAETTWIGHFMHDRWMLAKDIVLAGFKKEVAR